MTAKPKAAKKSTKDKAVGVSLPPTQAPAPGYKVRLCEDHEDCEKSFGGDTRGWLQYEYNKIHQELLSLPNDGSPTGDPEYRADLHERLNHLHERQAALPNEGGGPTGDPESRAKLTERLNDIQRQLDALLNET